MVQTATTNRLLSFARGATSLQLRERALSALCASTSGGSHSERESFQNKDQPRHDEGCCSHQNKASLPLSWTEADANRLHREKQCMGVGFPWGSTRAAVATPPASVPHTPTSSFGSCTPSTSSTRSITTHSPHVRAFATAAALSSASEADDERRLEFGSQAANDEMQRKSIQKSMASIKDNLSVPAGAELGPEAVNKFYTLTDEDKQKHLAEGFPKGLEKEFAQQNDQRILVRKQSLDLFERVNQLVKNRKADQYRALVLKGPKGSGKSAMLAHLVQRCRAEGWLVVYVPSAESWISGWFYEKNEASGYFDTSVQAEKALKALLAAHGDLLETLPIRVPLSAIGPVYGGTASVDLDAEELATGQPEEGNLKSLAEKGMEEEGERAAEMLARLRIELTRVQEVPVLIAIDEYNCWFGDSAYGEVDEDDVDKTRRIAAGELRLVHAFGQLDGPLGLRNGVVVAAPSETLPLPPDVRKMTGVYDSVRHNVRRLTEKETGAILTNYFACGAMMNASKRPSEQTITVAHSLTGGNGAELRYYGPLLQADRAAQSSPESFQPLLEEDGARPAGGRPAPRIRDFVQSLGGEGFV